MEQLHLVVIIIVVNIKMEMHHQNIKNKYRINWFVNTIVHYPWFHIIYIEIVPDNCFYFCLKVISVVFNFSVSWNCIAGQHYLNNIKHKGYFDMWKTYVYLIEHCTEEWTVIRPITSPRIASFSPNTRKFVSGVNSTKYVIYILWISSILQHMFG